MVKTDAPTPRLQLANSDSGLLLQAVALETVANAVMITDRAGGIRWVNPAFTGLTGYTIDEVLGKNPRLLKSGQHDAAFYKDFWRTILSGKTWHGEFTNRRKDGTLYHDEHTITPVRVNGKDITHFVAIMADITARKRAESELLILNLEQENRIRERTLELEAANRELETFVYSVAHDLRSPIRGMASLVLAVLEDFPKLDHSVKRQLGLVADSAQRINKLIDGLLHLSQMAHSRMAYQQVDLSALASGILADLKGLEPQRQVEIFVAENLTASGDPDLLRAVMDNLLNNAWKFTSKKSLARIEFRASVNNGQTAFFVRDNGAGFEMAYADKLFGPFQRLHSSDEFVGLGIGLATVQRIIHRHGGRIWAESKPDEGAAFHFTLPTVAEPN
jgi:PAS domain S-box-containing protein